MFTKQGFYTSNYVSLRSGESHYCPSGTECTFGLDFPETRHLSNQGFHHCQLLDFLDFDQLMTSQPTQYQLELRNVSYIRSFTSGRRFSKIINPPITAQFLKDVSFQTRGGEVMGIIGSGGSGKTTLLNVIARRVQGTTGGSILLNGRPLSEWSFKKNAAYVSFKQTLIPELTVSEVLTYQANMCLSSAVTNAERYERVNQMIREFELDTFKEKKIKNLEEGPRRRLLLALHLVRDPVMIVMDEPTRGLPPLQAYQLMFLLSGYMKRYNRIAVVTMSIPRSDIYPLLDRTTLLFFGEVIYSGYTKQMPQYFRHIGYPCPASENPAVYFASLATVDRETSARYLETQDQAVKLIETFKVEGDPYAIYAVPFPEAPAQPSFAPLSSYGRPNGLVKLGNLMSQIARTEIRSLKVLPRLFALPLFGVMMFLVTFRLTVTPYSPQTVAGLILNALTGSSLVGTFLAASSFAIHRTRFYQDSWDGLYNGAQFITAYLLATFFFDLISVIGFTSIIYWACNLGTEVIPFLLLLSLLWCSMTFAQLATYCIMCFVRSGFVSGATTALLLSLQIVSGSGVLKSLRTLTGRMQWAYYASYGSIYRYSSIYLHRLFVAPLDMGYTDLCCRGPGTCFLIQGAASGRYCRWQNGTDYMDEVFFPKDHQNSWLNFGLPFAYLLAMFVITYLLYTLPIPHVIKRKFRFK